jgi:hypothetical protein
MAKTRRLQREAQTFKTEITTFLRLCECVSTPRAIAGYLLVKAGEWDQYLSLDRPDFESDSFADDYLISEIFRKHPDLNCSADPTRAAKESWLAAEERCRETNEILSEYLSGRYSFHPQIEDWITKTQSFIAKTLGPLSSSDLHFVETKTRFGPGSTSAVFGSDVILSRKMVSVFDTTPALYPYWRALIPHHGSIASISLLASNKVTFVPKTSLTHRPIAVEPHLNIYYQLGVGALIRDKLCLAGLDLDKQADVNRSLAGKAQTSGLSTIDLSSASDTIASKLVELLLPPDWYALLSIGRSEYSTLDDQEIRIEKFSSMGNGFTFELETLIFWAIAQSTCVFSVAFGDDLVIDRESAPYLLRALKTFGFKVNEKKTFLAGRFFESCGADYLDGLNVRPFYFKGRYEDHTSAVIRICNKIRLYAHRRNHGFGCDIRFLPAWLFCFHRDSKAGFTGVPLNNGDDGLIRNFDEFCPSLLRYGHQGFLGKVWHHKPKRSMKTDQLGAYVAALKFGSPDISRTCESLRMSVERGQLKSTIAWRWDDPGAWCRF